MVFNFPKNIDFSKKQILSSIYKIKKTKKIKKKIFGEGDSAKRIMKILSSKRIKKIDLQKSYKNLI